MTERFSPEYKAFILSDEAKVLQEELRFERGARVIITSTEPINELGILIEREFGGDQWRIFIPRVGRIAWWVTSSLLRFPSLTDLLGMIEERVEGWSMSHSKDYPKGFAYQYSTEYGVIEINGSDNLLLAAAKLAVRVLEGKA